jgi:type IV pilus assembly protein PilO
MEQLIDRIAKAPPLFKFGGLFALCTLLTVANYFIFISDMEDQIAAQQAKQRQLEQQLAEKKAIAQNLNERRREMDQLEQKLADALTQLPENKDLAELLAQVNDVAKKSGLDIAHVEPGQEQPATFFAKIPIKMAVSGNYHELALFLQELANMRRIVNVNNIKLSSPVVRNDKVVLSTEFLATTFRFLEPGGKSGDKSGSPPK